MKKKNFKMCEHRRLKGILKGKIITVTCEGCDSEEEQELEVEWPEGDWDGAEILDEPSKIRYERLYIEKI